MKIWHISIFMQFYEHKMKIKCNRMSVSEWMSKQNV